MTTYSKFNPGTYWGKGCGANESQQSGLVTGDDLEDTNPLDLIKRYLSPSSSSSSSRDQDKAQGLWVRRTKRGSSFQYQAHRPVGKFYPDINIGWKEHDGFPRVMYAGRVISIRRTKGI